MSASAALPRSRARTLLVPAMATLVMLAVLLSLGVWQLQRLQWKLGILAEIDRAEASAPVPLPAHPLPFTKVSVTGHLRGDVHALYGADVRDVPGGTAMGAQLIEPLERPGQDPILIDRGWVPDGQLGAPAGDATITGYVRAPDAPGAFSLTDDPVARRYYTLDPAKIGAGLGLLRVAPFTLIAMGTGGMPEPATALPRPPNDHLNYALTWFGLAASLLVVFGVYARKVFRP
ncbi:SURF1 family protein [Acidisphaera sp. L21]|jgi:surfeit locus 1 family protein|uniref:SURF1 family protein n=1 Tax=Acidisphaera sp. L21 TaxID=1641851 RepID=UPI00131C777B|nr:SURF1 family protein [Acidisphaera sp. L21]